MLHWVFDYDNTLYHPNSGILDEIDDRIEKFISSTLNVSKKDATDIREKYYKKYGTTIQGLMEKYSVNPKEYFSYIMDIKTVPPYNADTKNVINSLQGKKTIFSNGNRIHIKRGLKSLGIENNFEDIFEIEDFNYISKPFISPYKFVENKLKSKGIISSDIVFIDDSLSNIQTANSIGWKGVLIDRGYCEVPKDIVVIDHLNDLLYLKF